MKTFKTAGIKFVAVPMEEYIRLMNLDQKNKLRRVDIARELGISKSTLSRKPYLLPDCDRKTKGIREYRWSREELEKWWSIPLEERIKSWRNE
jgi:hypothetical protein